MGLQKNHINTTQLAVSLAIRDLLAIHIFPFSNDFRATGQYGYYSKNVHSAMMNVSLRPSVQLGLLSPCKW